MAKRRQFTPVPRQSPERYLRLARLCARMAYENRATGIELLDISKLCSYADFFVMATAASRAQMRAIRQDIEDAMDASGAAKLGVEGESGWILMDFGDVVVQLFEPEARDYYALEELWADAAILDWEEEGIPAAGEATAAKDKSTTGRHDA